MAAHGEFRSLVIFFDPYYRTGQGGSITVDPVVRA